MTRYVCKQCGVSVTGNYAQAVYHKLKMHPTPYQKPKPKPEPDKEKKEELEDLKRVERELREFHNNLSTSSKDEDEETARILDNIGF